jgi:hypothetical protein
MFWQIIVLISHFGVGESAKSLKVSDGSILVDAVGC